MTEPVAVKFYESPKGYADAYAGHGQGKMCFSFIDTENKMIGPFVDCKEYVKARLYGSMTNGVGTPSDSYYRYKPEWGKLDLDKLRLLVVRQTIGTAEQFEKEIKIGLSVINEVEQNFGLMKSKFYPVTGIPKEYGHAVLVVSSKRWMLAPPMLDLFVVLLRNSKNYTPGKPLKTNLLTLKDQFDAPASMVVDFIATNKYWKIFGKELEANWNKDIPQAIASDAGIWNFSYDQPKLQKYFPHWKFV